MVAETRAKKALHAIQAKHPVDKRRITGASKQQDDRLQMLFDAFTLKRPELTMGVKWPKRDTIDSEESNHLFHHDQTNNPELDKEDRMNERIYTFLSKADYPFQPEKPKQRKWREKHTMMGNSSHWERTSGTTTHLATTRPVCKVPFFAAPPEDILLLAKTLHKDIHLNTTSYTKRWQRERRAFCRPSEEARLTPTPTPTPTSSTASTCSTVSTVSAPTTPTTTSSVHSQEKRQRKAVQEQEAEDHFFYAMQDFIIQQLPPLVSADACQEYGYNMIVDYLTRTCGQKMDDVLYSMTGRGEGVDHSVPLPIPERLDWKYMLLKLQQNGFPGLGKGAERIDGSYKDRGNSDRSSSQ
ncbi:hypothetical protein BDF20DRAFT_371262 [Mycotypha africana]|uniref:uncharacterized protein n=1 Tax=Mycotypha africana TaxID=64632 RepID=UPI002301DB17|nr:uncharacterized protein BDF20DRAFT_371262 [Mycotypha africana]KAI8984200.1 hypothetical protein BDF20DRAFT_371262 [Mycotypha africana]